MTNFEKFKKELTVERLAIMLADTHCEVGCDFCTYKSVSCIEDCEFGIKKFLESEVDMTTDNFNAIISAQIDRCESILCSKAKEYAAADRLHNFKVAGALQGIPPVQALMGMMAKHTVSVADMCMSGETYPQELWDEKITDSINYLLLLSALVRESFGYNRCIYCNADYQPYAISPHEAQIKDCDKICKDCLVRMLDEKLMEENNENNNN